MHSVVCAVKNTKNLYQKLKNLRESFDSLMTKVQKREIVSRQRKVNWVYILIER